MNINLTLIFILRLRRRSSVGNITGAECNISILGSNKAQHEYSYFHQDRLGPAQPQCATSTPGDDQFTSLSYRLTVRPRVLKCFSIVVLLHQLHGNSVMSQWQELRNVHVCLSHSCPGPFSSDQIRNKYQVRSQTLNRLKTDMSSPW